MPGRRPRCHPYVPLLPFFLAAVFAFGALGCRPYDVIIRGGDVYDGSGAPARRADVGIRGDRIAWIGDLQGAGARVVIDASGKAVAPGFINMLSWSNASLLADGRSQGEVRQGVTTQILGEGHSMGPLNPAMKARVRADQGDIRYDIEWTTLREYLDHLERRGVSQNVASFIGAATLREYAVGEEDRPASPEELDLMRRLVREEMAAGALGIASSLIYAPGSFASTEELIEISRAAGEHGGMYISHLRSEGNALIEAVEEFLRICREAGVPGEIYHLKAAGGENWHKLERVFALVEEARAEGLRITADIYTYTAGATGLDASIPLWARAGGAEKMRERFRDPALRARIAKEIVTPSDEWENLYLAAGDPDRIILTGFKSEALKPLQGKTLGAVARERGKEAPEVIMDLMAEDESRVGTVYFLMSEENLRKKIEKPWVSLCSDSASMAPEGVFLKSSCHPRAYGSFARLLGKYVREEKVIPLAEAIRKLTSLPAATVGLDRRGRLVAGHFADLVVFDPETIADRATYEEPHQYAVGVSHVLVNGRLVLAGGEHTGATPGRALRGPGGATPARRRETP
jgi:N-acyl-D-amino-acid deacylase